MADWERDGHVITDVQFQRIVELLGADVAATVAGDRSDIVRQEATRAREFVHRPPDYEDKVVEQVQQRLHDEFIDTTWPACPTHPNHPLWFAGGWWRCEASGAAVAELGQLSSRR